MKKLGLLTAIFLIVSVVMGGCGGPTGASSAAEPSAAPSTAESAAEPAPSDTPAESAETPAADKLVMATESGFAPYEYLEGDKIVGIDPDIAAEIAKEMGLELDIIDMPFDSIIPSVNSGKADFGAAGMSITPERAEQVDFTIEYATSKQVIITKADSGITDEAGLSGKTVGVQLGTVADFALTDDYPDVKVQQYNKYFEAANDLASGRIDAIVMDSLPAEEVVKIADGLVVLDKELFTDRYAFCVKKGNTELLDAINKVMQRLIDEGKIDEYTMKHLGE